MSVFWTTPEQRRDATLTLHDCVEQIARLAFLAIQRTQPGTETYRLMDLPACEQVKYRLAAMSLVMMLRTDEHRDAEGKATRYTQDVMLERYGDEFQSGPFPLDLITDTAETAISEYLRALHNAFTYRYADR